MSVICDKCGEQLMGAVNRCWNCGTPFKHIEGKPNPPVRRAPVLASYVYPQTEAVLTAEEDVAVAVLEEEPEAVEAVNPEEENTPASPQPLIEVLRQNKWLSPQRVDYPSIGSSLLAGLVIILGVSSMLAIPLGIAAAVLSVHLLNHRRSITRWIGFALGIIALLIALLGMIALIFASIYGGNFFTVLMSSPI